LPTLIDITQTIVDFIDEHPEEVFWGLATALGVAFSAFVIGQIRLFADALGMISGMGTQLGSVATIIERLSKIGVIYFGVKGLIDASEGNWLDAASNLLTSGGLLILKDVPNLAKGAIAIAAALALYDLLKDDGFSTDKLLDAVLKAGIAGELIAGPEGAMIAIGAVLAIKGIKWLISDMSKQAEEVQNAFNEVGNNQLAFGGTPYNKLLPFQQKGTVVGGGMPIPQNMTIDWSQILGTGAAATSPGGIDVALSSVENKFNTTAKNASKTWTDFSKELQEQNEHALGFVNKSSPMGWMLLQVEAEWVKMKDVAVVEIDAIIKKLNEIPKEIVTIHRVITVYETRDERGSISAIQQTRR